MALDKILLNTTVYSCDQSNSIYQAVGILGGHIAALGNNNEIKRLANHRTEIINLDGSFVFPGFIDSHNHLMILSYLFNCIDLSTSKSIIDINKLIKRKADQIKPGEWIKGYDFTEYKLVENRYPTLHDLDIVSPKNPVILYHTSFHSCVLNTIGLKEVGILKGTETKEPENIQRDPGTNEPTGVLFETVMLDVFKKLFKNDLRTMNSSEKISMCEKGTWELAKKGIVGASDALVPPESLLVYQQTLNAKKLKIRVNTMVDFENSESLIKSGLRTKFGNPNLKIGPIKIFHDGGMSSRTAAVSSSYHTPPYDHGILIRPRNELIQIVKNLDRLGFQIAIHAQGDKAIEEVLDAYEAVLGNYSENPLRHRIEHAGCLYPPLLRRAADMSIVISIQPAFISKLGDGFIEAFGMNDANKLYPFKSILNAGIILGGSSDSPVASFDPRIGLKDALMRKTNAGMVLGEKEILSIEEAIRIYTYGSAYLSFEEEIAGTIEINKRADFTILEENPYLVDVNQVPMIPIRMTIVGGNPVFDNSSRGID
jgi:predicted amidohydrolase YtcJ